MSRSIVNKHKTESYTLTIIVDNRNFDHKLEINNMVTQ